jgi:type I restriction enzyme, S subunit
LPPEAAKAAGLNPHRKMKDSGIEWLGEIPEHWAVVKFSRSIFVVEGQVDPRESPFIDMPLIAPNHVEQATGQLLNVETAREQQAESGKYLCRQGDVIYSKIRPALRKVVVAPTACLCSADMYPMRQKAGLGNEFLFWFLLSDQYSNWSVLEADRVAMPKINRETLNELRLPMPPIGEQTEVANFLGQVTRRIDVLSRRVEEAIDLLKIYRSALITGAVTGKIDVRNYSGD